MDNICKECGKRCETESTLHRHLKAHKMSQAAYYQKYFPRYDKYNNTLILFKTKEQYFSTDFNSSRNMARWLGQVSRSEGNEYLVNVVIKRKEQKDLKWGMSQVELRSLGLPGRSYLSRNFNGYQDFCNRTGLILKFKKNELSKTPRAFLPYHSIFCDTREQQPLSFSVPKETHCLTFGDYRLNDDEFSHNCCIERKSLGDFFGTICSGYERFCREIERAQMAGFYLIVVIESPMNQVPVFATNLKNLNVNISPEYVFHNMRSICQKHNNIQFLFVQNRTEASMAIERIFQSNGEYKDVDLQYLYDKGELIHVV